MQKSTDWLLRQAATIGSSAAGVVAGQTPEHYKTRAQLFDEMLAANEGRLLPSAGMNDHMRRGLITESLHRDLLSEVLGTEVRDHDQDEFIYASGKPWAHALPDGWIGVGENAVPVQLKCPTVKSWQSIKLKGIHGYWLIGSQHSLAITGAPYEHFSVLNVETMRVIEFPVYRDEELISALMEMERDFYQYVIEGRRPEEETAAIELPEIGSASYARFDGDDALGLVVDYLDANETIERWEEIRDHVKSKIKDLIGPVQCADLPGLRVYHRDLPGKKSIDQAALKRDGIDPEKYKKAGKPYKEFRAYRMGR